MMRGVRMALGWVLGGLVWALVVSLVLVVWEGRNDLGAENLVAMLQAGLTGAPAAAPGALVFLGLGLLLFGLMGRATAPVGAGGFGGLQPRRNRSRAGREFQSTFGELIIAAGSSGAISGFEVDRHGIIV